MKKKILSILTIGIVSLSLIGCNEDKVSTNTKKVANNRFVSINDSYNINGLDYSISYDSITNIVYISGDYKSGITPLIGKDKLPMTLDEYNKTK